MNKEPITTDDITKKAKNILGNGRGTLLLAILGVSLSTASAFMFCLASIGFDFSLLVQSAFWSRWASMCIATLSAYFCVLIHKDEKNRLNPWYTEKLRLLMELSISTGFNFDAYIEELNEERKEAWFKNDINAKISVLSGKIVNRKLKGKSFDDLEAKIKVYQSCITPGYLAANKYLLKTHSRPIRASQVLTEKQNKTAAEENFLSPTSFYGGKTVTKVVSSLIFTAAISSVVVQNFEAGFNAASVVMTIFTLLSVTMSIMSAVFAANGCYKNVHVPNLLFKIKILTGYNEWQKRKTPQNGAF